MKFLLISVLSLAVLQTEVRVYAEEGRPLEDLLGDVVQELTPALDAMRRHKALLEEKMGVRNFPGDGGADTKVLPSLSNSDSNRDPFATTFLMKRKETSPGGPDFRAFASNTETPELTLRGIITGADGDRLALLDVFGADVYLVREGDTISLHGSGRNTVIKVREVSHLSLTVSVGTLGEVLIVR